MLRVRVVIALGALAGWAAGCAQQRPDGIFDGSAGGHTGVLPPLLDDAGDPSAGDVLDESQGTPTDDVGPGFTDDTGLLLPDTGTGGSGCSAALTCSACAAVGGCGWCGGSSQCMAGTTSGPRGASCPAGWSTRASSCGTTGTGTGSCTAATTCGACTALSNCGWCGTTGRCGTGTILGPNAGTCAAASWAWVPANCSGTTGGGGTTDPCASTTSCLSCVANTQCGWCLDSASCHGATISRHTGPDDGACAHTRWAYSTTFCSH